MRNAHSKHRGSKGKEKLRKTFHFAKSTDEKLKAFTAMEPHFQDEDLIFELMQLTNEFVGVPEKVLFFGKRALTVLIEYENKNLPCFGLNAFGLSVVGTLLDNGSTSSTTHPSNHAPSLFISNMLFMLGKASLELKRFNECLSYANWANRNLNRLLDHHSSSPGTFLFESLIAIQGLLGKVNADMGRKDEVPVHLVNILGIKKKLLEEGCIELGQANMYVYKEYVASGNAKEALPYCLKALEIYETHLGRESKEVASILRDLSLIYSALGESEKALVQNQLSQCVVKHGAPVNSDLVRIQNGQMLIKSGRNEEAVNVLKGLVTDAATEEGRVIACTNLVNALLILGNFADAEKYLKTAREILEKKKIDPFIVATAFNDMSKLYEIMNDYETAIYMLRRALAVPELPVKHLPKCSARLYSLIGKTGKKEEGIQCLEHLVEIIKKKFGPAHCEVGYGYKHLGLAYLNLGQHELAVKLLETAKDIMDASLGPHHSELLTMSQALSVSYWNLRRYEFAIDTQQKLVDGLKGLGASKQQFLDKAVGMLNQMKKCVIESPAMVSPQSKEREDLCEAISKCVISDDQDLGMKKI